MLYKVRDVIQNEGFYMKISSDSNVIKREIENMSALQIPYVGKGQISYNKSQTEEAKLSYIILPYTKNTLSKHLLK